MLRVLVTALLFSLPAVAADAVVVDDKGAPVEVDAAKPPPPPPEDVANHLPPPASTASELIVPVFKTLGAFVIVLLLVWLTLAKGMGKLVEKAQAGKRVRVIERISLDARRSLFLVDVDGKQILIGGGDVVRLGDVDADGAVKKADRQSIFDKVIKGGIGTILTETKPKPSTTTTTTTTTTDSTSEPA